METAVNRVMAAQTDMNLMHLVRTLNAELEAFMLSGQKGTQAHNGMLEMVESASQELSRRGYLRGMKANGSDLPVDVQWEDGPGGPVKLSFAIRVF